MDNTYLDPSLLPSSKAIKPILSQDFDALRRETANKIASADKQQQKQHLRANMPRVIHHLDEDTMNRLKNGSKKMSEYLHHLANEPSIGLYHVCDHITRNVPKSVETKKSLKATNKTVEDLNYDMDFTIRTVRNLHDLDTFKNIRTLINDSITTIEMIKQKVPAKPKAYSTPTEELLQGSPQPTVTATVVATPTPEVTDTGPKEPSGSDDSLGGGDFFGGEPQGGGFLSGGLGSRKKKIKAKKTTQTEFKPKAFE